MYEEHLFHKTARKNRNPITKTNLLFDKIAATVKIKDLEVADDSEESRVLYRAATSYILMMFFSGFEQASAAVKAENLPLPKKRDVIFQRVIRVDSHEEAARAGSEP